MHWIITILLIGLAAGCQSPSRQAASNENSRELVGYKSEGGAVVPVNQTLTPAGRQVELPGLRPQVVALSPDGRLLATSGKTHELIIINPESGNVLQNVPLPSEKDNDSAPDAVSTHILDPDKEGQVSYTGLVFSPDGRRIYLANVNGSIKVFSVNANHLVAPLQTLPLPDSGNAERKAEIPAGLALSPDGQRLYVALNLSNRLLEMDALTGKVLRLFDVGVAPYGVVLVKNKIYVSNWGGRRPDAGSLTGPAGRGTLVRVDPVRHIASEGSVTVIDLDRAQALTPRLAQLVAAGELPSCTGEMLSAAGASKEILAGLHASGLALSPDQRHLAVANAGNDTVTVIDIRADRVVETISLRWHPNDFFGASPNALAFDATGRTLFVCHGTQNAVGVVSFRAGKSKLRGLIPAGWFPGDITFDSTRDMIHVANIKGLGSGKRLKPEEPVKFNTHQYFGTLSLVPVPRRTELAQHTSTVLRNYRRAALEAARLPPRQGAAPRPVPERSGEPSVFKHVVYIIKENRTYDQVFGDMKEGNGMPDLCIFGERITPNQHKLAREFVLLDNTYCSGILSADGHNWSTAGLASDYLEKSFAGFPRSYPDGMEDTDVDALAYSPAGFIWDKAIEHGKSLRVYGEFAITEMRWKDAARKPAPTFPDVYRDFVDQTGLIEIGSRPAIESLRPYLCTNTVGWSMDIPDVFRAAQFIKELREFERNGSFPNLSIICLPNDHTSGTKAGMPTPAAHVADNDLAFGQIVEAVSRSRFWKETCIIAIEDDPQDGWDHVTGYRTTAYVVSPYTKRGAVVSVNYNQTSVLRTIGLILGLPPMNIFDATATPMSACFTDTPDFTPFAAVPNNIPLDQLNPAPHAIADPVLRHYAQESARLPLHKIDACPEDLFNRILWTAQKGSHVPYPAWAINADDDDEEKEDH